METDVLEIYFFFILFFSQKGHSMSFFMCNILKRCLLCAHIVFCRSSVLYVRAVLVQQQQQKKTLLNNTFFCRIQTSLQRWIYVKGRLLNPGHHSYEFFDKGWHYTAQYCRAASRCTQHFHFNFVRLRHH